MNTNAELRQCSQETISDFDENEDIESQELVLLAESSANLNITDLPSEIDNKNRIQTWESVEKFHNELTETIRITNTLDYEPQNESVDWKFNTDLDSNGSKENNNLDELLEDTNLNELEEVNKLNKLEDNDSNELDENNLNKLETENFNKLAEDNLHKLEENLNKLEENFHKLEDDNCDKLEDNDLIETKNSIDKLLEKDADSNSWKMFDSTEEIDLQNLEFKGSIEDAPTLEEIQNPEKSEIPVAEGNRSQEIEDEVFKLIQEAKSLFPQEEMYFFPKPATPVLTSRPSSKDGRRSIEEGFPSSPIKTSRPSSKDGRCSIEDGFSGSPIKTSRPSSKDGRRSIEDGFSGSPIKTSRPSSKDGRRSNEDGFSGSLVKTSKPSSKDEHRSIEDGFSGSPVKTSRPSSKDGRRSNDEYFSSSPVKTSRPSSKDERGSNEEYYSSSSRSSKREQVSSSLFEYENSEVELRRIREKFEQAKKLLPPEDLEVMESIQKLKEIEEQASGTHTKLSYQEISKLEKAEIQLQKVSEEYAEISDLINKSRELQIKESDVLEVQKNSVHRLPSGKEIHKTKIKLKQIDEVKILKHAVQLLESRTSFSSFSNNCKGILGIMALEKKIRQLITDKEEIENRLDKCSREFSEVSNILNDKARILIINNKEIENFIKVLKLKLPDLEKATSKHDKEIEDIKYRFQDNNIAQINELKYKLQVRKEKNDVTRKKIQKVNEENDDLRNQMELLESEDYNYKSNFNKRVLDVKSNLMNLQLLNSDLQKELEIIQSSDIGQNETFQLKIPKLKQEIDMLSNEIKSLRKQKNNFETENGELRKKLKKLVLRKVMDTQHS